MFDKILNTPLSYLMDITVSRWYSSITPMETDFAKKKFYSFSVEAKWV